MKITWNNIHHVALTLVIANFIFLYFLKRSIQSSKSLDILYSNNVMLSKKENKPVKNKPPKPSVMQIIDINNINELENGYKSFNDEYLFNDPQYLSVKIQVPKKQENKQDKPDNLGVIIFLSVILVSIMILISYYEINYLRHRNATKFFESVEALSHMTGYTLIE